MKKIVLLTVSLLLVVSIATVAFAAGVNGDYKGNAIVNVIINGVKQVFTSVPAINYNSSTMLPLRACVEGVNGIVEWDSKTQTASVIKPETDVYFFNTSDDGKTLIDVYSKVPILDEGKTFYSAVDICNIPKGTYTIKIEIINQSGTVVMYTNDTEIKIDKDNGLFTSYTTWDSFTILPEVYQFKISMKDKSGSYKTIATKTMDYR